MRQLSESRHICILFIFGSFVFKLVVKLLIYSTRHIKFVIKCDLVNIQFSLTKMGYSEIYCNRL